MSSDEKGTPVQGAIGRGGPGGSAVQTPGGAKSSPRRRDASERGLSDLALAQRRAAPYLSATSTLLAAVGGCTAAGWALDRWLGHEVQWMLIAGAVIGIAVGFVGFFSQVLQAEAQRRRGG